MRNFIFIIATVLATATTVNAQRAFTRQNITSNVYYTIDSVFLTANNGDTINLPGGSYMIGNLVIDKRLTIIGAGHYPDSTSATFATTLNGSIYFVNGSNNSSVSGISLNGSIYVGNSPTNQTVQGLNIYRNSVVSIQLGHYYYSAGTASYINIKENVIRGEVRGCQAQFVNIEQNLINGHISFFNGNLLVRNNTFLGGSGCPAYMLADVNNSTLENNIFMNSGACANSTISGCNSNIFTNNVFNGNFIFPYGTNIGTGNQANVSFTGFFVNETDFTFDYTNNYHLQNPLSYLGTDGTQVGVYGTATPYKESAVPVNPHIRSKSIAPQTNSNGDLNINISVGSQNR